MTSSDPGLVVALQLRGRRVLLVGGGAVAADKCAKLLAHGALVTVVAPQLGPKFVDWTLASAVVWHRRPFAAADVADQFLVVAATGVSAVDAQVFAACEANATLCNAADVPAACSVFLMAQRQHGEVVVAAGTAGTAPGLAGRLAEEAADGLPADVAALVARYATIRRWILDTFPDVEHGVRTRILRKLAREPWENFRCGLADQQAQVAREVDRHRTEA